MPLKSPPASGDPRFFHGDERRVEEHFVERTVALHRVEPVGDDVLGEAGVAADVPFGEAVEGFERDFAEDVAEVEVGFADVLDVAAANFAPVAFVALRHGWPPFLC